MRTRPNLILINEFQLFLFSTIIFMLMLSRHGVVVTVAADDYQSQINLVHNNHYRDPHGGPETILQSPVLIIQNSEPGVEEELLGITSRVNRAYAMRWGFDYMSYIGSDSYSFLLRALFNNESQNRQTGANGGGDPDFWKLVDKLPNPGKMKYEIVMFLQSDAIMVQLDYNIEHLIKGGSLVAGGVDKDTKTRGGLWNFYSDVMLWNLNHPLFDNVTDSWLEMDQVSYNRDRDRVGVGRRIDSVGKSSSNMVNLAKVLMETETDGDVLDEIPRGFVDGLSGTIIKQPGESPGDLTKNMPILVPLIQGISDNVCYRYYPQCEIV